MESSQKLVHLPSGLDAVDRTVSMFHVRQNSYSQIELYLATLVEDGGDKQRRSKHELLVARPCRPVIREFKCHRPYTRGYPALDRFNGFAIQIRHQAAFKLRELSQDGGATLWPTIVVVNEPWDPIGATPV